MKKLTILASAVAAFSISAAAVAQPQLYVGGQLGLQDTNLETSFSSGPFSSKDDFSINGFAGNVFTGVKFDAGNGFFISPEINVGSSTADGVSKESYDDGFFSSSSELKAEAGTSYGAGVLLGSDAFSGTSLYGRLGYQRTEYELTSSATGQSSVSEKETFDGFRLGIGMETAITSEVAVRLDWTQTIYSDESYTNSFGDKTTFEPTESLFQAGISYYF